MCFYREQAAFVIGPLAVEAVSKTKRVSGNVSSVFKEGNVLIWGFYCFYKSSRRRFGKEYI